MEHEHVVLMGWCEHDGPVDGWHGDCLWKYMIFFGMSCELSKAPTHKNYPGKEGKALRISV